MSEQILTNLSSEIKKYNNEQKLDGIQQNPNEMKSTIFKQDYVVIIRKKLYYAISQADEEQYIRVYQVNNFMNLTTSHNVYGTPGSCSVSIKGAERIICADKPAQDTYDWQSWEHLLGGWLNINDGDDNNSWTQGKADWALGNVDGLDFKNMLKAREAKYGWKFAEKCDFEPMDEIHVFGKTRNKLYRDANGMYKFFPIFFGYIDQVTKTYSAGNTKGLLINIRARDQLKILEYSRISNVPTKFPGALANGGYDISYNLKKDEMGSFIVNDDFYQNTENNQMPYYYTNVFAGKTPYDIITRLALDAGVPRKYLEKRIEKIEKVPFVMQIAGKNIELIQQNTSSRLQFCKDAANKLFVEFFCDEEGNLVFKIPSYSLGANRLPENNMGHIFDQSLYDSLQNVITSNNLNQVITNNTSTVSPLNNSITNEIPISEPIFIDKTNGIPSVNYMVGRNGYTPIVIVDHYTAGSAELALAEFQNPHNDDHTKRVSSQYIVTKNGEIWRVVKDENTAYHAGLGTPPNPNNHPTATIFPELAGHINSSTIGIEHEGFGDLTDKQYIATLNLHNYLCITFNIPKNKTYIIGHQEINPLEKQDPGPNFPWTKLIQDLNSGTINSTSTSNLSTSVNYRTKFINAVKTKVGFATYKNGSNGPDEFDCSGLVCWGLKETGLQIDNLKVVQLFDKCPKSLIDKSKLQNGDLAFHEPRNEDFKQHVGICKKDGEKIEWIYAADEKQGIVIKSDDIVGDGYWQYYGNIIDVLIPKPITTTTTTTTTTLSNSKIIKPTDVTKFVYTVVSGDTLRSIAEKFLYDGNSWKEIYYNNINVIGKDPNTIIPKQQLIIYQRDPADPTQNKKYLEMKKQNDSTNLTQELTGDPQTKSTMGSDPKNNTTTIKMGKTLSEQTDQYIPEIKPEDIISFTITDSDSELYNMYEVQLEPSILDVNTLLNSVPQTVRRIAADFNMIARFGMRPAPSISTPLINSVFEAQIFGMMMMGTSFSKRITGSLSMIEDSRIKIGDPIRFHAYDETPYKETGLFNAYEGQAIFYVEQIDRNIDVTNVSTMTLTLKAGRMMGQESIFDQMLILYQSYFIDLLQDSSKFDTSNIIYENYQIQSDDTWNNIIFTEYGFGIIGNVERATAYMNAIIKSNPDVFGVGVNSKSMTNDSLIAGKILKIPKNYNHS